MAKTGGTKLARIGARIRLVFVVIIVVIVVP
jgi:hypothetical protein